MQVHKVGHSASSSQQQFSQGPGGSHAEYPPNDRQHDKRGLSSSDGICNVRDDVVAVIANSCSLRCNRQPLELSQSTGPDINLA